MFRTNRLRDSSYIYFEGLSTKRNWKSFVSGSAETPTKPTVALFVLEGNQKAIEFYQKWAFVLQGKSFNRLLEENLWNGKWFYQDKKGMVFMKRYILSIVLIYFFISGTYLIIRSGFETVEDITTSFPVNDYRRIIGVVVVGIVFAISIIQNVILLRKNKTMQSAKQE